MARAAAGRGRRAIVVGGGHNGLTAAFYLARAGLAVSVLERRGSVGGAAVTEEVWPGFRFSPCAHSVHGIHPAVLRDLRLRERGLEIIPRPFELRLLPDGSYWASEQYESPRNRAAMLTAVERAGAKRFEGFLDRFGRILAPYRLRPPPTAAEAFERALRSRMSDLYELLPTEIQRDDRACGLTMGAFGRDPVALTAAYWSILAPDEETGERPPNGYVRGGMGALTRLLATAAEEAGATLHTDSEVDRFVVEADRVLGVRLAGGGDERADVVLSSLDPKRTLLRVLGARFWAARFGDGWNRSTPG